MSKFKRPPNSVPPDGGWGWVVVLSFSIVNVIMIPILQSFTLIFRDVFQKLKFSATDISTIITVNTAFGMILGLCNGPRFRKFGYRKVAVVGGFLLFFGLIYTAFANSFFHFIISYGLIVSVGFLDIFAAFSIALNSYFSERRSKATGVCVAITGIGPIIMPLLISFLLKHYGVQGTVLIIAALSFNIVPAAMLLQPIKWHYKYKEPIVDDKEAEPLTNAAKDVSKQISNEEKIEEEVPIYELDRSLVPRRVSDCLGMEIVEVRPISGSQNSLADGNLLKIEPESTWWKESKETKINQFTRSRSRLTSTSENIENKLEEEIKKPKKTCWRKVVIFFDLDLLKDMVYRDIWIGMSLAYTGELMFSLMMPVFLDERKFNIDETAKLMSVLATSDIIFRLISPFVGDKLKFSTRTMYMAALFLLVITRTSLTFAYEFWETMTVCIALGVAKGFRTVYMALVIPNYVPIERLPAANGLQTLLNGIIVAIFGPVMGSLKDTFGSYNICIYMVNTLTILTILLWCSEYLYTYLKTKNNESVTMTNA